MAHGSYRFDRFLLDPDDRRLRRDDVPVEINARYLDALALLVSEPGKLVSKDRFLAEVWRGVPVTDEALTQCIKSLRRQLGDDAARPRFIETVPKHGYRFIAPVERAGSGPVIPVAEPSGFDWRRFWLLGGWGTIGGAAAGLAGGLIYGFAGDAQPLQPGMGSISVLLVVACISMLVALVGAAGVAFGIAAAAVASGRPSPAMVLGGALGGLIVGALVKLIAVDAFNLLLGRSPGDITGAAEGALLGGTVGLAAWLVLHLANRLQLRKAIALVVSAGGAAGALIPSLGGRLMGGTLVAVTHNFPGSRLTLDSIGRSLGESAFGPVAQTVTAGLEGALFAACVVGAMVIAWRADKTAA